jgi:hypothetical protein
VDILCRASKPLKLQSERRWHKACLIKRVKTWIEETIDGTHTVLILAVFRFDLPGDWRRLDLALAGAGPE